MCVPKQKRTLSGEKPDLIYKFFEKEKFCDKYVVNIKFLKYMKNMCQHKNELLKDKIEVKKFTIAVTKFVEVYPTWNDELRQFCVGDFLLLLTEYDLFDEQVEPFQQSDVSFSILCYHLGILTCDYIDHAGF